MTERALREQEIVVALLAPSIVLACPSDVVGAQRTRPSRLVNAYLAVPNWPVFSINGIVGDALHWRAT